MSNPLDRSAAHAALLDLSRRFRQADMTESTAMITRFLGAFDNSGQKNMYEFARAWVGSDERTCEGLKLHAMSWAFDGMRSSYDTAQAYGDHIEHLYRVGELDDLASHKDLYPAFVNAQSGPEPAAGPELEEPEDEIDVDREAEVSDYLESLEKDALDGPHFYDSEPELDY